MLYVEQKRVLFQGKSEDCLVKGIYTLNRFWLMYIEPLTWRQRRRRISYKRIVQERCDFLFILFVVTIFLCASFNWDGIFWISCALCPALAESNNLILSYSFAFNQSAGFVTLYNRLESFLFFGKTPTR